MTTDRSARAEVIDLDSVRRARQAKIVGRRLCLLRDEMPSHSDHFTLKLAESITLQDALVIALGIVHTYSAPGVLLRAFIELRVRGLFHESEEFHEVLKDRRKKAAKYSPERLKALMALYKKKQSSCNVMYTVPAAEEFLNRFQKKIEEA